MVMEQAMSGLGTKAANTAIMIAAAAVMTLAVLARLATIAAPVGHRGQT
ncbi:MAG: hypothetical protein M3500_11305 [Actinomycetota bacterium]|nr:hypothetical protein [Actinomycetota bacterium]